MKYLRDGLASVAMVLLAHATPAGAAAPEEAFAAFLRGDYAAALPLLEPLAVRGEPQAQYFLALMYDMGQGVPPDPTTALKWYRSAAAAGICF